MRSLLPLLLCWPLCAAAAPTIPAGDAQVLATVPARATDPRARAMLSLRQAWLRNPQDLPAAVTLAGRYFDEVAAEGDPRYVGYAQAVLQPWWSLADPPVAVRVLRGMLLQFDHRFPAALADLDAALSQQPDNGQALSWQLAILMVQADYTRARAACERLAPLASPLIAAGCRAQIDAVTGHAASAAAALRQAVQANANANATTPERLWALTRLAEIDERRGDFAAAESAYRQALALGEPDVYLMAAYADFLLDRGRNAEVLLLLQDHSRADVLLLRLTQAAKAAKDPSAGRYAQELAARFDAARQRGDATHRKEEARFALAVQGDAPRALALARENYAVQREPIDARILLEAALAAGQPAAAQPALDWMAASGIESLPLQALARQLKGQR